MSDQVQDKAQEAQEILDDIETEIEEKETPEDIGLPEEILNVDPENLIQKWKFSGVEISQLSADAIFLLGKYLRIAIISVKIELDKDEKHYIAEAIAKDLRTGQTMFGHSRVPIYRSNSDKIDPNAYESVSTKVQRNAMRKLIPHKYIKENIENQSGTEATPISAAGAPSAPKEKTLAGAKQESREALMKRKDFFLSKGVTTSDIFKQAEEEYGPSNEWDIAGWEGFTETLNSPKGTWIEDFCKNRQESNDEAAKEVGKKAAEDLTQAFKEGVATATETSAEGTATVTATETSAEGTATVTATETSEQEPVELEFGGAALKNDETEEDETEVAETEVAETDEAEESTEVEEETAEVVEAEQDDLEQIKESAILAFSDRKDELEEKGITSETFWRLGVAKRYGVSKKDDLSANDWGHLEQSLKMPDFAEWITDLQQ